MEEFTKKYCRNCEHAEQCCKYTTGYYYEDGLLVKCERYKNWENKRDLELKFKKSGCATDYTFDNYLGDDTSGSLKKVKYIAANPEIFKNAAIYVYGTNGTQKTSMLKVLCKKLIEQGYSAQFMSLNTLINSLMVSQSFDKEEAIKMAREALDGCLITCLEKEFPIPDPVFKDGISIEVSPKVAFAINLRKARANETMKDAAAKVGMTYQQYQRLENPYKTNPTLEMIFRLQKAFNCSFLTL